jgi:hypothetical protein
MALLVVLWDSPLRQDKRANLACGYCVLDRRGGPRTRRLGRILAVSCCSSRARQHWQDVLIAGTYSEEQIRTFGEIIGRLAQEIESSARFRLAGQSARTSSRRFIGLSLMSPVLSTPDLVRP